MLKLKVIEPQGDRIYSKLLQPKAGTTRSEYLIGRHPSCGLTLDSPEVSRIHGRILFQNGNYYYSDLGSTDGSRINNINIVTNQQYRLQLDDMIRVGDSMILVEDLRVEDLKVEQNQSKTATSNHWTSDSLKVTCVQIIEQTHDVKTFRFIAHEPENPILFHYKPGQFITLELEINQRKVYRSYSISSSPSRPHTLEITVKRVPDGLVSNWLHDTVQVGTVLKVQQPLGEFTCANQMQNKHQHNHQHQHPTKLLLISAGSGITPMMSMSQWLCDTAAKADIIFFHSARSAQDLIFRSELELLNRQQPQFKLAVTMTHPDSDWMGYSGRINPAMLQAIAPDFSDRWVYVCGPAPFMVAVKAMLSDLNFPMANYFEESFGRQQSASKSSSTKSSSVKSSSANNSATELKILFSQSGKEIICDREEVILEAAEREGVALKSGCRIGACGVCKQKLLEGSVNYIQEPGALKQQDKEDGLILTCIACPVDRVVICA
jgi:glycine betaine catabolism B